MKVEMENDEFDLEMSTNKESFHLPMPKISSNQNSAKNTILFMEENVNKCSIVGYSSTLNFLKRVKDDKTENTKEFINYLASLQFSGKVKIFEYGFRKFFMFNLKKMSLKQFD
jgi:hypothetical protein